MGPEWTVSDTGYSLEYWSQRDDIKVGALVFGGEDSFVRGGSLGKPIQRIDTAQGWLRREEGTVARPDSCLAGRGHVEGAGAVV